MLKNISIKVKIITGVSVLFLALMISIVTSWKMSSDVAETFTAVSTENFPAALWAGKSQVIITKAHGAIREYNLSKDETFLKEARKDIQDYKDLIEEQLSKTDEYPQDMIDELKEMDKISKEYISILEKKVLPALEAENYDESEKLISQDLHEVYQELLKQSTNFMENESAEFAEEKEAFIKSNKKTHTFYIVMVVISVLIGVFLFIDIVLNLIPRLHKVRDFAQEMATRDLTISIEAAANDELGAISDSLNDMTGELRTALLQINSNTTDVDEAGQIIITQCLDMLSDVEKGVLAIDDISSSMNEMTVSFQDVSGNTNEVKQDILGISSSSEQLEQSVMEVEKQVEQLSSAIETSVESVGSLTTSIDSIAADISAINDTVADTTAATKILIENVDETEQRIAEINSAMHDITGQINTLSEDINRVSESAKKARDISDNSVKDAENGREMLKESISSIQEIKVIMSQASGVIERLSKRAEDIGEIVNVISEIADQTNLLALNAAIEAARAGEHGRGFAVVADEVRKLAERSGSATQEIAELISGIQRESGEAVQSMQKGNTRVDEGVALTAQFREALEEIINGIYTMQELVTNIEGAAQSQQTSAISVDKAVENISAQTAGMEEITKQLGESSSGATDRVQIIAKMAQQILHAVDEQKEISEKLGKISSDTKLYSSQVGSAAKEQTEATRHIVRTISNISIKMEGVSSATTQQAEAAENINNNVNSLKDILHGNRKISQETYEESKEITQKSLELGNLVATFKIGDEALLNVAKGDHLRWVNNIRQLIEGRHSLSPDAIKDHTCCRLGKWYYGPAMTRFGDYKEFKELETPHKKVHAVGIEIYNLCNERKEEEGLKLFPEMVEASKEVLHYLESLKKYC